MKKKIISVSVIASIAVFVCICTVVTVLLAVTNFITAPIIQQNLNASANAALLEVMPEGKDFETVDLAELTLPGTVTEVYKEKNDLGYVIKLTTAGYGTDMIIMCGVTKQGVVTGATCLSSNETLGKEKTYGENFGGKDALGVEAVDTIGGATKTTAAYKNAIVDAMNAVLILSGGSVDLRSEEEILLDNLSAALPTAEGQFEKMFIVEDINVEGDIYAATNGAGYVFVRGEEFIAVLPDGSVAAETENAEAISEAIVTLSATTYEDIDITLYEDLSKTVISAKKTASGNYIVETKGAGYGIKGGNEYHPASGEYIIVRVAMTADGKILDCITVSQAETAGIGDACANEDFYGQFDGKTEENYTEIDAIGGATFTTDGYKQAISRAFAAVKILSGGEQ